jgi:enoyl-CoA hydratase/carnithine racemase
MGLEMAAEFQSQVAQLAHDRGVRALIITGAGAAFSAGGDLAMLTAKPAKSMAQNRAEMLNYYQSFLGITKLPFPIICALNGHAIGAGLGLALACDIRLVSNTARLGLNFTRLGLHPGMGTTFFLPRLVGHAVALDLLTTGRVMNAEEALTLGMVSKVVAPDELAREAQFVADEYRQCGPAALAGLLQTLRPTDDELARALTREADEQSKNYASAEFAEGLAAALEKRSPSFVA